MAEEKEVKKKYRPKSKMKGAPVNSPEPILCYFCGKVIKMKRDLASVQVPLNKGTGKVIDVSRDVHIGCATEYMDKIEYEEETFEENDEWGKCYDTFKNAMGVREGRPLSKHGVLRLRGLRIGKFYPKGENVKNIKRGYSYEEIRLAILFCTPKIRVALSKKNGWKNGDHQINYAMTIIANNINFVAERLAKKKLTESTLDQIDDSTIEINDHKPFINKTSKEKITLGKTDIDLDTEKDQKEIEDIESLFI